MTTTPEAQPLSQDETIASLGNYGYGWSDTDVAGASAQRGLSKRSCVIFRPRRTNRSGCSTSD